MQNAKVNAEFRMQNAKVNAEFRMQSAEFRMQSAECRMPLKGLGHSPSQYAEFIRFTYLGSGPSSGGGDDGIRTHDPLLAGQVLSQLSYTPIFYGTLLFLLERSFKIEQ